ncbi:MAG: DNA polymerase I, partial [Acidimicrobiales bacterium]
MDVTASDAIESLRRAGVGRGDLVGLAVAPGVGLGLATVPGEPIVVGERTDTARVVSGIDAELGPRWVMWSSDTAAALVGMGVRVTRSWDLAAVHRLLRGGWRADPGRLWAAVQDLPTDEIPTVGPHDLFSQDGSPGDPDDPIDPAGHLRPEWVGGGWAASTTRLGRWAELARAVADLQRNVLDALADRPTAVATARSESAAELLCVELAADGLPVDRRVGEQ